MFYGVAQVPEPPSSQSQAFQAFYDILEVCWSILSSLKTKKKEDWKPNSLIFLPTSPMCTGVILGEMSVKVCRCRRKEGKYSYTCVTNLWYEIISSCHGMG